MLLVLVADPVIEYIEAFQRCVKTMLAQVQIGKFGVLGIVPADAVACYEYIKMPLNLNVLVP